MSSRDVKDREERTERSRRNRDHRDRHDRDRDRRSQRDRHDKTTDHDPTPPIQGPIVLLKRPGAASSTCTSSSSSSQPQQQPQKVSVVAKPKEVKENAEKAESSSEKPVVLLRPKVSSKRNADTNQEKEPSKPVEATTTEKPKPKPKSRADILKLPDDFPFETGVTIIDKEMKIQPMSFLDFFEEYGKTTVDYFVVTAIGKPSSGKSAILSYLANRESTEAFGSKNLFPERTLGKEMESFIYVTSENTIFIEVASIFNYIAACELTSQHSMETAVLMWNLRLIRWALAISHIVLVISDNMMDPSICQFVNSAEMLQPMESTLGEGYFPELIFVCNKESPKALRDTNAQSKCQVVFNTMAGRSPRISPNLFVLPHLKWEGDYNAFEEFRRKTLSFINYNRARHAPEKKLIPKMPAKYCAADWYSNITKVWEEMSHPNYFAAYSQVNFVKSSKQEWASFDMKFITFIVLCFIACYFYNPQNTLYFVRHSVNGALLTFPSFIKILSIGTFLCIVGYTGLHILTYLDALYQNIPSVRLPNNMPLNGQSTVNVSASGDHTEEFFDFPDIFSTNSESNSIPNSARRRRRMLTTLVRDSTTTEDECENYVDEINDALAFLEQEDEYRTPKHSPRSSPIPSPRPQLLENVNNNNITIFQAQTDIEVEGLFQINGYKDSQNDEQDEHDSAYDTEETLSSNNAAANLETLQNSNVPSINLSQFPRGVTNPCLSCDGMYLETFIRLTGLSYTVSFDCLDTSGPFLVFGGEKICGSNDCLRFLKEQFSDILKPFCLNGIANVTSRPICLILDSLFWDLRCWRWLIGDGKDFQLNQPGWDEICKDFDKMKKEIKENLWSMGFGRMSSYETLSDDIMTHLRSLSFHLGTQSFLLGESATELDCQAFSILSQLLWGHESILQHYVSEFRNVAEYCKRIAAILWPDWDDNLAPHSSVEKSSINLSVDVNAESNFVGILDSTFQTQYYQLFPILEECESVTHSEYSNTSRQLKVESCAEEIILSTRRKVTNCAQQQLTPDMRTEFFDDEFEDMQNISLSSN